MYLLPATQCADTLLEICYVQLYTLKDYHFKATRWDSSRYSVMYSLHPLYLYSPESTVISTQILLLNRLP